MNFTLKIWRQKDAKSKGAFESYKVENISADTSFLEMLDILNNNLIHEGKEPVAFDHDCREGICGMCSLHIDGQAHGPSQGATTCQIYMRKFKDGATITIEPRKVILVEGILIFADPALSDLMDIRVFVDADADVRLARRVLRDTEKRGRTVRSVVEQWQNTVKPMHEKYVEPSKKNADIIVPQGGKNPVALDLIVGRIQRHLDENA
jgi:succinate dehydrogenase/fumarate reductase-like Fe-S protein